MGVYDDADGLDFNCWSLAWAIISPKINLSVSGMYFIQQSYLNVGEGWG